MYVFTLWDYRNMKLFQNTLWYKWVIIHRASKTTQQLKRSIYDNSGICVLFSIKKYTFCVFIRSFLWRTGEKLSRIIFNYTVLTLAMLNKLTLVLLNPDISCLCKQCRSRSVGFWRSKLIWICTVPFSLWIYIKNLDQEIWLADN